MFNLSIDPSNICKSVLHILLLGLLLKVIGSDGLRDVRLESNQYFRLGEDANLRCSYDLESETLYAVKWYRGAEEFYRFIPKELRPKQVFPTAGISVDYIQSNDHHVILKNVSYDTNGRYKCVVSVDGSFQTISSSKDIGVVAVGYDSPRLYLEKVHYRAGDTSIANCTLDKTFPPANITWFINDKMVSQSDKKVLTRTVQDDSDPKLTSTISMLLFRIPPGRNEPIIIKCVGQLYDIYKETSVTRVLPMIGPASSRELNDPDSLQHSTSSAAQNSFLVLLTSRFANPTGFRLRELHLTLIPVLLRNIL